MSRQQSQDLNPKKLTRKAIVKMFPAISETQWLYLFTFEKKTGLFDCRISKELCKRKVVFYSTDAIKIWLMERGYYMPSDFAEKKQSNGIWADLSVRTHQLAG